MINIVLALILIFSLGTFRQDHQTIRFSVDMHYQIMLNNFKPSRGDRIVIRGNFNNWTGNQYELHLTKEEDVYELEIKVPIKNLEYKYVVIPGNNRRLPNNGWETISNRVMERGNLKGTIHDYFNNIKKLTSFDHNFKVDMSNLVLQHKFDHYKNKLIIGGSFNSWDEELVLEDLNHDYIYEKKIKAFNPGTLLEYKYAIKFSNSNTLTWETSSKIVKLEQLRQSALDYFDNQKATVQFQVDMSDQIQNKTFKPNLGDSIVIKFFTNNTIKFSNYLNQSDRLFSTFVQFSNANEKIQFKYAIVPFTRDRVIDEQKFRTVYTKERAVTLEPVKFN